MYKLSIPHIRVSKLNNLNGKCELLSILGRRFSKVKPSVDYCTIGILICSSKDRDIVRSFTTSEKLKDFTPDYPTVSE